MALLVETIGKRALQGYYTLRKFGSEGLLGSAVALSLIRGTIDRAIEILKDPALAATARRASMDHTPR